MTGSFRENVEFRMREVFDDPEAVRLVLSGELDMAVAEMLGDRLRRLRNEGYDVRLDLAELEFIDSSGLRELIIALAEARCDGWRLDIDPQMTGPVRRTIEVAGLHSHLWPDGG
jgi:anti-anti-sigma factor